MGLFPFPTGGSLRGFGSRRRSFHRRHPRLRAAALSVATEKRRPDPSPAPLRSRRPRLPPGPPAPHVRCFSAAHRPTLEPALRARPLFFSISRGPLLEWVNFFSGLFWSIFSSAARLINRNVTWHTRALSLLVTNTGIGLAISVKLYQVGFITYASMSSLAKADELQKAAATAGVLDRLKVIEMDVGDDASVTTAVKAVLADTGNAIDVVISNAGYIDTNHSR